MERDAGARPQADRRSAEFAVAKIDKQFAACLSARFRLGGA
jgi:hypothetical protein